MTRASLHKLVQPFSGLQAKACITLMVIVMVTAAAIGTTAFRKARAQMVDAVASQTLNTARLIAAASYERYTAHDSTGLIGLCQHLVVDNRLLYMAFVAPDGRIVAAAQKPHTLVGLLDDSGRHLKASIAEGIHLRDLPGQVTAMEAAVPIMPPMAGGGAMIGTLVLAMDLAPLQSQLSAMANRVIELTSAIAILVITVGFVVMRRLVGPINRLADASIDLAYKHEYQRIELTRNDELGRLTQAFNHMAERLLRTQRELMELNGELEKRVALRTVELETRNKQLNRIASKDPLTGLYNRRSFNELLAREIAEAQRYGHELACLMIDLDNFKQVNDIHGHQAGDTVLQQAAEVIAREMRQCDVAARFGGDEFVVLLPQCNAPQAFHLAKRIRDQCRQAFAQWNAATPKVSLSIGIADLHVSGAKTGDALVRAADKALYKVKTLGKDGISAAKAESIQAA